MSSNEALHKLSLDELEARLRDVDRDRAVLQRVFQQKLQQTRKNVAQEVKELILARGHDVLDIVSLIANKKSANTREAAYVHYVDPNNPKNQYIRGVLPNWMKKQMTAQGLNPNNRTDRKLFKEKYLERKTGVNP